MSITLTLRTQEDVVAKLTQIAEALDRDRNWVINDAIRNYLELHAWQLEEMAKGRADTEAGRTISHEDVKARILRRHQAAKSE
jgi:predicted transcriptional regulator